MGHPGGDGHPHGATAPSPGLESALGGNHGVILILKQGKLKHGSVLGARAAAQSRFWGIKAGKPHFSSKPPGSEAQRSFATPIHLHPCFPEPGAKLARGSPKPRMSFGESDGSSSILAAGGAGNRGAGVGAQPLCGNPPMGGEGGGGVPGAGLLGDLAPERLQGLDMCREG